MSVYVCVCDCFQFHLKLTIVDMPDRFFFFVYLEQKSFANILKDSI